MIKHAFKALVLSALFLNGCVVATGMDEGLKNGDIIFQTSTSSQSKAIQLATGSKYSHMGIIYFRDSEYFVHEAVQPVKLTPLREWINRGEKKHYVVKRLKDADRVLTKPVLKRMQAVGEEFSGKNYDVYFEWSDERIYCSELVWKIYKQAAGIEIGELQPLRSFDLTDPVVAKSWWNGMVIISHWMNR
ncbi:permuted papain-like amidase YaeF/Yiix C92 family enzyme [Anseongella ginsenosidimutans]|uniref:Permuted papain-like amidase YaeF/Yiix C92 family enzyme n=1 Tax=Anseongella ginsenosidimutans TaxID=496056 RepID=A0A4R3KL30_9SPHI|nr:YiiX family permuted papain-like enzyme [Anseongella ginsenosidimutans]TCS84657.1 permuted papain-like amidase YaeF/Yiix C92 family enzyme [Anseongella ginsenosidimutans]